MRHQDGDLGTRSLTTKEQTHAKTCDADSGNGTALIAAAAASPKAAAVLIERIIGGNATAFCQSALPAYEGLIRKRPLALQNEGTSDAFVSCSLPTNTRGDADLDFIDLYLLNNNPAAVTANCTLVIGFAGGTNQYFPKSRLLGANSTLQLIQWTQGSVNGGNPFAASYANVSCQLPPGTGIGIFRNRYMEDIGQ